MRLRQTKNPLAARDHGFAWRCKGEAAHDRDGFAAVAAQLPNGIPVFFVFIDNRLYGAVELLIFQFLIHGIPLACCLFFGNAE